MLVGCEAQDGHGCGFEISGPNTILSGCTADPCGNGTSGRYSAGFYVNASGVSLNAASYQRSGGTGSMMWGLNIASGVDYLLANVVCGPNMYAPFQPGGVTGSAGSHSSVTVLAVP